jgi:diguanylate cyclase (GGDEF)-like protein
VRPAPSRAGRTASHPPVHDVSDSERLLEEEWKARDRRLPRRELMLELGLTMLVGVVAIVLLLAVPAGHPIDHWTFVAIGLYAIATRIAFPLGANAYAIPTQLFLPPLFALAPPSAVPALVLLGLFAGSAGATLRGAQHGERLAFVGGDAGHALGPALVFVGAGVSGVGGVTWELCALAVVAQLGYDLAFSVLREWVAAGVRPRVQLRVSAQIWAVDLALTPLGVAAALHVADAPWTPLGIAPMLALLHFATRDRNARIERAQSRLHALERERRRLRVAVRRVGEAFASNLDLDAVLRITTRAAVEALDADEGRASAAPAPGRDLRRRITVHEAPGHDALLASAQRAAVERGGPAEAHDAGSVALACPIPGPAGPAGVVVVAREGEPFSADERELLAELCENAAVSAANAVRHETLHRQALTDELTGLANHRRFQELLSAAVERHHALGERVALLLLDLDDFKRINDTHGHQTGDAVLAAVGRCIRHECRVNDEPARYGGEELAVLLPDAGEEQAEELGERLRSEIAALELVNAQGDALGVTVSIGVASLGERIRTKQQLIAAADDALYEAKADGKNRVAAAEWS